MGNREYRIQLKDRSTATNIVTAGGTVFVTKAGLPDKATLFDKNGAALANPLTPTRGFINFFVVDTTAAVDLYIQGPSGAFLVMPGVVPSGPNEVILDQTMKRQDYKIPFSNVDAAALAETFTGFVIPVGSMVLDRLHGAGLDVTAIHTGKTIDVGTSAAATGGGTGGTANGLISASSVGTLGRVIGTNGAFFSTNAPATDTALVANLNITYTLSSTSTTAKGFIHLPVVLF